jgi:hypothetical protein
MTTPSQVPPAVTTPAQAAVAALARPAVPSPDMTKPHVDMTKPVQPAVPPPDRLAKRGRGDELESWFDQEMRPVLLRYLAEVDRQHQDHQANTFRALRHWLGELPRRAEQQPTEARAFAKAIVSELRGLLGEQD